ILGISFIHTKIQPNVEKKITGNTTLPPLTSNQTDSRLGWKLVYLFINIISISSDIKKILIKLLKIKFYFFYIIQISIISYDTENYIS
ncbi:hypothetical protein ACTHUE_19290, partial [Neisseria sp. P0021.S005]|uniref:hypothetical protein n=1 Tax=Neisseria sp. P0021.S005 TaxID=3436820 RepID=UPI003F7D71A7